VVLKRDTSLEFRALTAGMYVLGNYVKKARRQTEWQSRQGSITQKVELILTPAREQMFPRN
jgi:hypothetical protein